MTNERTLYREWSPWPGWVGILIWSLVVLVCYPLLAGWDVDLPFTVRAMIAAAVVAGALLLRFVLGGMTALVQESRLFLHMGSVPLVRKVVPYAEIVTMRPVTYRPIVEFGGWGIRGFGRKRAWTARGNRALVLQLLEGRELYVGSDHPQRLEERIRTAAAERLGRARAAGGAAEAARDVGTPGGGPAGDTDRGHGRTGDTDTGHGPDRGRPGSGFEGPPEAER